MSHEPGRERHMVYRCEMCSRGNIPLMYVRSRDAYICSECQEIRDEDNEEQLNAPPTLDELLAQSRKYVESLTPEQKAEMLRKQAEGWARSEAQWARDFAEGKTPRD